MAGTSSSIAERRAYVNARLFDPARKLDLTGGVLIEDGVIKWMGDAVSRASLPEGTSITDVKGALLIPGLIDMRVFTGEPGSEHRETLHSASLAAAAGGVTSIVIQPNTQPVMDDASIVDFILRRAQDTADVRVYPMAAITKDLNGEKMTEFGLLKEAGAIAVTDAVHSVRNSKVLSSRHEICRQLQHAGGATRGRFRSRWWRYAFGRIGYTIGFTRNSSRCRTDRT